MHRYSLRLPGPQVETLPRRSGPGRFAVTSLSFQDAQGARVRSRQCRKEFRPPKCPRCAGSGYLIRALAGYHYCAVVPAQLLLPRLLLLLLLLLRLYSFSLEPRWKAPT